MKLTHSLTLPAQTGTFPRIMGVMMDVSASSYYRLQVPLQALKQAGYPVAWGPLDIADKLPLNGYDMVLFSRTGTGDKDRIEREIKYLQKSGLVVMFDYDDEVLNIPEFNPGHHTQTAGIKAVLSTSDAIVVTNQTLEAAFKPYCKQIGIVPNYVDIQSWPEPFAHEETVIGLFGSPSHVEDWKLVAEPMRRIRQDFPEVRFMVAGYAPDYLADSITDFIDWIPLDMYPQIARAIDIGLCPLIEDQFNKCKTPIKAYECSMSHAAVVASPTQYRTTVQGRGRIARNTQEWYDAIAFYITHPAERKRDGLKLRAAVERLDASKHVPSIAKTYKDLYTTARNARTRG